MFRESRSLDRYLGIYSDITPVVEHGMKRTAEHDMETETGGLRKPSQGFMGLGFWAFWCRALGLRAL